MNSDKTLLLQKRLSPFLCKHDNHSDKKRKQQKEQIRIFTTTEAINLPIKIESVIDLPKYDFAKQVL